MPSFNQFTNWLFPGDELPRIPNPADTPPEILPLLEEVAGCTNIPLNWLENVAGLVIEGLAGLQCLWYLHGLRGEVAADLQTNWRYGTPENIPSHLQQELINLVADRMVDGGALKKKFGGIESKVMVNWAEGRVLDMVVMLGEREFKVVRALKLGKWLRKHGASPELLHAFETRELPSWEWEISCNPYDILTMSHERPWTSCMRPGGEYQYGPLTDMAAGSALMFFYRPGATKPCGRRVLRPAASPDGVMVGILDGGRTYGCGPKLSAEQISEMLAPYNAIPIYRHGLCPYGRKSYALTRYIYSDIDHQECSQEDAKYDAAYINLDSVDWPPINLDFTTTAAVAESFRGLAEVDLEDAEEDYDVQALAYAAYENILGDMDLSQIYDSLVDLSILQNELSEWFDWESLANEGVLATMPEHIMDDIFEAVRDYTESYLIDQVNGETTLAFAIPPGDHEAVRVAKRDAPIELNPPEYTGAGAVQALNLFEWDDGEFHTEDDEEVAEILLVSEAFRHYMPNSLWNVAVATGELSEWFDWEFAIRQDI